MRKRLKLVCGTGVNDADYQTQINEEVGYSKNGKQILRCVWRCPYYTRWQTMMRRCYSEKLHVRQPEYAENKTVPEWHYFMTFRGWMEKQDWEGKHLDKDLLVPNNKIYGPDTCAFIDARINTFLTDSKKTRGKYPIGVSFRKSEGLFTACCNDVLLAKTVHLGYFSDPQEAHQAWLTFKLEQAKILANDIKEERLAEALIDRYENYQKYFGDGLELNGKIGVL